jgi:hypothetical protein
MDTGAANHCSEGGCATGRMQATQQRHEQDSGTYRCSGCKDIVGDQLKCGHSTNAEIMFPPTTGHGWASGLDGTAKMRTADAPNGATMMGT